MTRALSEPVFAALQARKTVARDFMWLVVRDRSTGEAVSDGYWSDVGQIQAAVIDPNTGGSQTRTFYGSGTLIQMADIPMVLGVSGRNVEIRLSGVADRVNNLVRTYDCKQGQVQVFRGMFDPQTRTLIDAAFPRFVGYIDNISIPTPAEGQQGDVTLTCVSHARELLRSNPDTRSDVSQRLRSASDNFFQDVGVVGEWELFWGKNSGVAV